MRLDQKPVEEAHNKKVEDRLAQLAASFASFTKKTRKIEVIDVPSEELQEVQPEETRYLPQEADAQATEERLDAVQESGPETMDVCQRTNNGEEMGPPHSEPQNASQ
jgi:hypothetical protein